MGRNRRALRRFLLGKLEDNRTCNFVIWSVWQSGVTEGVALMALLHLASAISVVSLSGKFALLSEAPDYVVLDASLSASALESAVLSNIRGASSRL